MHMYLKLYTLYIYSGVVGLSGWSLGGILLYIRELIAICIYTNFISLVKQTVTSRVIIGG